MDNEVVLWEASAKDQNGNNDVCINLFFKAHYTNGVGSNCSLFLYDSLLQRTSLLNVGHSRRSTKVPCP